MCKDKMILELEKRVAALEAVIALAFAEEPDDDGEAQKWRDAHKAARERRQRERGRR